MTIAIAVELTAEALKLHSCEPSTSLEDALIATLIAYLVIAGAFFAIDAYEVL